MKIPKTKELNAIKEILVKFPEGITLEEIKENLDFELELRTLQRRLKILKENGGLYVSGGSKATKYHPVYERNVVRESDPPKYIVEKKEEIPISKEGKKIKDALTKPLISRPKVGYIRQFLESYRPNVDQYLSEKEIKTLTELGKTGNQNQPAGTHAKEVLSRLLIDLSWNSSRLEGNTYSLLDTQRLVNFGESADGKSIEESQMILNHKEAIEFLVQLGDDLEFNSYIILNLHALLADNLLQDQNSIGRLRSIPVGIHKSAYTPLSIPQLIADQFELILQKVKEIQNPFEQAFFIMVHFPYLQPFDDVNKRTSRLAANIPFFKHNLSPLSFVDVPNEVYVQAILGVYELNRIELLKDVFIWAYERSAIRYAAIRQTVGEPDAFRTRYRNEIRELVTEIISNNLSPKEGSDRIKRKANEILKTDQNKFIEYVESELLGVHEGSFARFRVSPAEFHIWKENWSR
ncbi:Fic family protein [Aquiflexum sp. LQ15W]|uniref:Fic family protein n=1 Tax=Cognataquiflexum nitidum TaxID=2922272 RepID=UPI001F135863|nr:Fic family protein [Cognataquiflexum nitidum]MCH6198056.1 Fic family protein [Cognataquiflexum nitidum]